MDTINTFDLSEDMEIHNQLYLGNIIVFTVNIIINSRLFDRLTKLRGFYSCDRVCDVVES